MASNQSNSDFLADGQWMREHRGDPQVIVIDARAPKEYWAGHIAGARHFDPYPFHYYATRAQGLQAFRKQLEWIFGTLGVTGGETVVFYENDTGMRATRAAWALEYVGHHAVRILDGGLRQLPDEKLVTASPTITPAPFREHEHDAKVAGISYVQEHLAKEGVQIFDVRSPEEYFGENVRSRHGGAIPGAVNLNWTEANAPSGSLKPAAELRAMYESIGLKPDAEIITYCQGGYRAAHAYYALRRAGFTRVRNYVGSWGEWGNHDDVPIEHPRRPS
jgi:thiosulfate/3-mercaptopyruvate sulfurtransferase